MTIEVALTGGKVALVDDQDAELVSRHKWRAVPGCRTWHAIATTRDGLRQKVIQMHRLVLGLQLTDPDVDHINWDGLDNRRCNLRLANQSQNNANRPELRSNTSGYRGVTFHRRRGKWQAQIQYQGRNRYLGVFPAPEEAARAYDRKAAELFGAFARPNFAEHRP